MAPHSEHSPDFEIPHEAVSIDVPVLVVGGGPTGLLEAHMLSKLGVKSLVVERYPKRLAAPKAHALSPRSLEICRQFGIDVNEIRNLGTKRIDAFWVNFVTSLTGIHVGSLPYERMDVEVIEDTPTMIHNIPQPTFEELVARHLAKDGVEVRKNHSFVRCEQFTDYVITTIEDRSAKREYQIRSNQVIACDGARSRVRECLGITCEGSSTDEMMMTIHFNANLRSLLGEHVGMLHWVMDPEVSGFIIGYDLSDNQVLICNFDSKKHPVDSWDETFCRKTVTAAIGQSIPFDVLSFRPWIFSRKVAKSYGIGNVFLAGDAAHSFPPTGGLGLNSGLGDVHNLAYKISLTHHLHLPSHSLLSTYQAERKQIALVNSSQSVKNGLKIFGFLKQLGATDPDVSVAKRKLFDKVRSQNEEDGKEIEEGIEGQREHFDNHGLHIGYVYGDTVIPCNASLYERKFTKGSRLPHVWLKSKPDVEWMSWMCPIDSSYVSELTKAGIKARQWSVLDLCAFDAFTLFIGRANKQSWISAIEKAKAALPSALKLNVAVLEEHYEIVEGEKGREWVREMKLEVDGGVLVRPDQHILAVLEERGSLREVLEEHLGL